MREQKERTQKLTEERVREIVKEEQRGQFVGRSEFIRQMNQGLWRERLSQTEECQDNHNMV